MNIELSKDRKSNDKRFLTVDQFKNQKIISIRKYYEKEGTDLPSTTGITLKLEELKLIVDNIDKITEFFEDMKIKQCKGITTKGLRCKLAPISEEMEFCNLHKSQKKIFDELEGN